MRPGPAAATPPSKDGEKEPFMSGGGASVGESRSLLVEMRPGDGLLTPTHSMGPSPLSSPVRPGMSMLGLRQNSGSVVSSLTLPSVATPSVIEFGSQPSAAPSACGGGSVHNPLLTSSDTTADSGNRLARAVQGWTDGLTLYKAFGGYNISCVAFGSDSASLLTGHDDGRITVYNIKSGRPNLVLRRRHKQRITAVSMSNNGRYIISASEDETARLWDAKSGSQFGVIRGHKDCVTCVAFSPDGARIATGSRDTRVRIWNTDDGNHLMLLHGHEDGITSVCFSPDGFLVATASDDGDAKLWSASGGHELATFKGHEQGLASVAFSPDGAYVITASVDETARIWEVATGMEVRNLRGHTNWVESACFSPDRRWVFTGGADKKAMIWESGTGRRLATLGHSKDVDNVAFSPDGRFLLTRSGSTIRLWSWLLYDLVIRMQYPLKPETKFKLQQQAEEELDMIRGDSKDESAYASMLGIFLRNERGAKALLRSGEGVIERLLHPKSFEKWLKKGITKDPQGGVQQCIDFLQYTVDSRITSGKANTYCYKLAAVRQSLSLVTPYLLTLPGPDIERVACAPPVVDMLDTFLSYRFAAQLLITDGIFLALALIGSSLAAWGVQHSGQLTEADIFYVATLCTCVIYFVSRDLNQALAMDNLGLFWPWIQHMWTIVDFMAAPFCTVLLVLCTAGEDARNGASFRIIGAMAVGSMWLRLLGYIRVFSVKLAKFVQILFHIAQEIYAFCVVLAVAMCAFASMFYIVLNPREQIHDHNHETDAAFDNPPEALLTVFRMMLGDFDRAWFDGGSQAATSFSLVLLVGYLFIIMILMLNVLIAVVSDEYDRANTRAHHVFQRARLETVALMVALFPMRAARSPKDNGKTMAGTFIAYVVQKLCLQRVLGGCHDVIFVFCTCILQLLFLPVLLPLWIFDALVTLGMCVLGFKGSKVEESSDGATKEWQGRTLDMEARVQRIVAASEEKVLEATKKSQKAMQKDIGKSNEDIGKTFEDLARAMKVVSDQLVEVQSRLRQMEDDVHEMKDKQPEEAEARESLHREDSVNSFFFGGTPEAAAAPDSTPSIAGYFFGPTTESPAAEATEEPTPTVTPNADASTANSLITSLVHVTPEAAEALNHLSEDEA